MIEYEFLSLVASQWKTFIALSLCSAFICYILIRRNLVGGIFDPLSLTFVAGYSVNYAIIFLLWLLDETRFFYLVIIISYGLIFLLAFKLSSRLISKSIILNYCSAMLPARIGSVVFLMALSIYGILSIFLISSMGLGIFAETNRFEAARGYGAFVRILDCLSPFIVSYSVIQIFDNPTKRGLRIAALIAFILYAALLNGAKISVVVSLITAYLTLCIVSTQVRVKPLTLLVGIVAALSFAVIALSINLRNNQVEQSVESPLYGTNLILERFLFRIIASGDTSYLTLPNSAIEMLQTDSALVRFAAPLFGIGNMSNLMGYDVADLSVGRQALKYHDPNYDISGGPTSHIDLFAYVYFGTFGGGAFVVIIGWLLGSINRAVHVLKRRLGQSTNTLLTAWIATIWSRSVLMIIDPPVGFAYMIDCIIILTLMALIARFRISRRINAVSKLVDSKTTRSREEAL